MSQSSCRWGILSTAGIAKKNWRAIRRSGNGRVVAVASRNLHAAESFIADCQSEEPFPIRPEPVEGYRNLIAREDIDAIYIPLPTGYRTEWILEAARAGKHVLAEKPAGVDASEVEEILATCQANHVQYMDGVMFMHSQRMPKLRETLDDGKSVGKIRRVTTQFSFCADRQFREHNIRSNSLAEPHGCLGDLGWYCIRMILWALRWQKPIHVTGRVLSHFQAHGSPHPVPSEFTAELQFAEGVSAGFYCSFVTNHQQWAHISGDQGFVYVPDFVLPYHGDEVRFEVTNSHFLIDGCDFHMEQRKRIEAIHEYSSGRRPSQEVNLFHTFSRHVHEENIDPTWGQMTLATQQVLDALWNSSKSNGQSVIL